MSYSSAAELERLKRKDKRELGAVMYELKRHKETLATLKKTLYAHEVAIAELGKDNKALRHLITKQNIRIESMMGGEQI